MRGGWQGAPARSCSERDPPLHRHPQVRRLWKAARHAAAGSPEALSQARRPIRSDAVQRRRAENLVPQHAGMRWLQLRRYLQEPHHPGEQRGAVRPLLYTIVPGRVDQLHLNHQDVRHRRRPREPQKPGDEGHLDAAPTTHDARRSTRTAGSRDPSPRFRTRTATSIPKCLAANRTSPAPATIEGPEGRAISWAVGSTHLVTASLLHQRQHDADGCGQRPLLHACRWRQQQDVAGGLRTPSSTTRAATAAIVTGSSLGGLTVNVKDLLEATYIYG